MAYESPISVWWSDTKIEQLRNEYGNLIVRAVKNVFPNVDKDELIKALQYDRGQYEKGFADGIAFEPPVKTHGDRIRVMSDEELAEFLWSIGNNPATGNVYLAGKLIFFTGDGNGWLDWLKQEAEE